MKGKGLSCDGAIERIYAVYGSQRSVTSIIDAIRTIKLDFSLVLVLNNQPG